MTSALVIVVTGLLTGGPAQSTPARPTPAPAPAGAGVVSRPATPQAPAGSTLSRPGFPARAPGSAGQTPGSATPPSGSSGSTSPVPAPATGDSRTAPSPEATTGARMSNEYRLSVGDKLRIEVYKDPQLSQSVQIRPDGKITLPLLGDVQAAGFTPIALRDELAKELKEYITNPVVTVIVVEATPATVFVMGEVNQPGAQPMTGEVTVMQALSMAGGFKDFAKTSDIRILRKTAAGTETIRFNYKRAIKGEADAIALKPGDIVVVP